MQILLTLHDGDTLAQPPKALEKRPGPARAFLRSRGSLLAQLATQVVDILALAIRAVICRAGRWADGGLFGETKRGMAELGWD